MLNQIVLFIRLPNQEEKSKHSMRKQNFCRIKSPSVKFQGDYWGVKSRIQGYLGVKIHKKHRLRLSERGYHILDMKRHLVYGIANIRLEYAILFNCLSTVEAVFSWSTFLALVANNHMKARSIQNWFVIIISRCCHFYFIVITIIFWLHHEFSIAQLTFWSR